LLHQLLLLFLHLLPLRLLPPFVCPLPLLLLLRFEHLLLLRFVHLLLPPFVRLLQLRLLLQFVLQ
jgi:hypothetical protein